MYVTAPLTVSRGYRRASLGSGSGRDAIDQFLDDDGVVLGASDGLVCR